MMPAVVLQNLSKSYHNRSNVAVKKVSLSVEKGEIFGLIGPDGAGKTSIFRMLATLILPSSGQASIHGYDCVSDFQKIRQHIGYMPGKFSLYQDLTVEENLTFFATIFNTSVTKNYNLIKDIYIQLEPFKNRRAGQLSGGMKQKLALCCALIHRPSVLLLDEPTTGVDTVSRKEFWAMLKRLKKQGITILVSTPYMDEASLCERIALLQEGEILSINTPENIIKQFPEKLYAIRSTQMSKLLRDLRNNPLISSCNTFGEFHHITFKENNKTSQKELLKALENQNHEQVLLKEISATIEDCFIKLLR